MGNKTRAASHEHRQKQFAKDLQELEQQANGRTYQSWERANAAYFFCFPGVGIMPDKYDEDDSPEACEDAVVWFINYISEANDSHPYKRKFRNPSERLLAFNTRFPKQPTMSNNVAQEQF